MGGRLDSTNVIKPLISIITNIGYEHTNRLGKKLDKIAYEKSGIIKNKVPVVAGARGTALDTIREIAKESGAPLFVIDEVIRKRNLNLKGNYQQKNAAIASLAVNILNNNHIKINRKQIELGLKKAKWPGRFDLRKNVLIDVAHNPAGFRTLFHELKNLKYDNLIVVLGFSKDKDVKAISKIIKADKIILTQANNERAMEIETIKKYFKNKTMITDSKKALEYAKKIAGKKDLILIAGSVYLVGEIM